MNAHRLPRRTATGFTLVEVMVALVIMAVLAGMAFRGIDALVRAKDRSLESTDRTLKLNTGMSQFEYDVSQMVNTQVVEPATFDGATLRLTRHTTEGLQLVVWTLQDRRWQRWASAPMTKIADLQDAWLRTQQWDSIAGNAVTVLNDVDTFQAYSYCNGWGNFQSSCGGANPPNSPPPPPPPPNTPPPPKQPGTYPTGIRVQLGLKDGTLSREKELPAL